MKTLWTIEEAAEALRCSVRTIQSLTATGQIPHRKLRQMRRVLLAPDEVEAWLAGAELEVVELPGGGRCVRPKAAA